jgi:hypothetical protein
MSYLNNILSVSVIIDTIALLNYATLTLYKGYLTIITYINTKDVGVQTESIN